MESEIEGYIKVWIVAFISLTYCYFIPSNISIGKFRFLSLLPVFYLFTILPLNLKTISLGGTTAFFLTWLGNFKLLLFCFGKPPLSSSVSLSRFISIACLPIKIKIKQNKNPPNHHQKSTTLMIKGFILALLSLIYEYKHQIHPKIMLVYYCIYLYLGLELVLALVAVMAALILGFELEPQFNEPYLSTSLQDFWGRRWNLMVTNILRPTVYDPLQCISIRILGPKWAPLPAVFGTFVVSGLMHELIFYYLGRVSPTWEVTCFFVLQGFCVVVEILVKKIFVKDRWRLHPVVSALLTIGFVMVTGFWLFFPQLIRCETDVRSSREVGALLEFVMDKGRAIVGHIGVDDVHAEFI